MKRAGANELTVMLMMRKTIPEEWEDLAEYSAPLSKILKGFISKSFWIYPV